MTAKEYLISKYPDIQIMWNETGHDDSFMERMMTEYAAICKEKMPTDKDIENAASDYCNEHLFKELPTIGRIHKAYQMGARDMRSNKIYISPKNKP